MKLARTLCVAILTLSVASTGCFALDELDKGNAILDAHRAKPKKSKNQRAAVVEEPSGPADGGQSVSEWLAKSRQDVSEWWRQALEEEPTPPDPNDGIGRCEINGSISFKRRSDCELRGGRHSDMRLRADSRARSDS